MGERAEVGKGERVNRRMGDPGIHPFSTSPTRRVACGVSRLVIINYNSVVLPP